MKTLIHKIVIVLIAMAVTITIANAGRMHHKKEAPVQTTYEQPVIDQLSTAYFEVPVY